VHFGAKRSEEFSVETTIYNTEVLEESSSLEIPALSADHRDTVTWHHFSGLHEVEKISALGKQYQIPSLTLEDILNTAARPKIEKRDDSIFVVAKLIAITPESASIDAQQLSIYLLPNQTVLTFLEGPTHVFDPVRERIRTGSGGRIRKLGADYLVWAILDAVIDHYLYVIDRFEETLGQLEDQLEENTVEIESAQIYSLKRDVGRFFRSIRPVREIASSTRRGNSPLLEEETEPYFADLNDHVLEVIESSEDLKERASSLREFYLSKVSNRMNEVMKVLTCFSTIFLPLTFIAGIYGMNFEHMPELGWKWAYPLLWSLFLVVAAGMFWLFRKKNWL